MDKPKQVIALLAGVALLIVGGAAFALSRTSTLPLPIPRQTQASPFADRVTLSLSLSSTARPQSYLLLSITGSYSEPIDVSGWSLEVSGEQFILPEGSALFRQGVVNTLQPIALYPGETALISFNHSPVGTSFRENECSPLLQKFQNFIPSLQKNSYSENFSGFYNDCVFTRSKTQNFYLPTWRIYVSASSSPFLLEHGAITLRDADGLPISTLTY